MRELGKLSVALAIQTSEMGLLKVSRFGLALRNTRSMTLTQPLKHTLNYSRYLVCDTQSLKNDAAGQSFSCNHLQSQRLACRLDWYRHKTARKHPFPCRKRSQDPS